MDSTRLKGRIAAAVVLLAVTCLLVVRLSSFGIWDPWELSAADLARQVANGEAAAIDRPPLATWLVAAGFSIFGVHEWSGRLPIALAGLAAVALAYLLVARFAGRRAGVWSALVAATSPLFLFNARQMLGASPGFAASAAVFLCAMSAVFLPTSVRARSERARLSTIGWAAGLVVSAVLATLASGVMLGVAPPLLAVAAAILARNELAPPWRDRRRAAAAAVVTVLAIVVACGVARAVWADYAGFGLWTGGTPRGGTPPTWEVAIERLFHSFAPWSALLPIALGRMLLGRPHAGPPPAAQRAFGGSRLALTVSHPEEGALRIALVAWIAFGYLAQTLFTARYGPATFLPLVGAAAAVALTIRDVERSERPWWAAAIVAFFFVGLVIRDYRAYPGGPIEGLAADGFQVPDPEVFNPIVRWAVALGSFALLLVLGLSADPRPDAYAALRADARRVASHWLTKSWKLTLSWLRFGIPVELLGTQIRRGPAAALWVLAIAYLFLGMACAGVAFLVLPDHVLASLGLTSLVVKVGIVLVLVPPAVVVTTALGRLALFLFGKLGSYRLAPAMVASLGVAAYASQGFLPDLSSHFSPREVYDTYNALAREGEPLGEFRVGGRAAAYYARGEIQELATQAQLIEFLGQERRVWAAFRADDLAAVNREYRRRHGRHLFVADARSARMVLATNQPVEGMSNQNYLADAVLDTAPRPEHPTRINFDNRIELLGFDLDLPHGDYVGPGELFKITWYFRVLAPVPGGYQPFVHIDGPGQRINGDHEPVGGRYPVRLWEAGDIVVDRQELRVPGNYRRGDLTIFMGFYSGETRLEIVSGPKDDANRGRAGILRVR